MCDFCGRNPCDPRCPYAPEPPTVYICAACGEPIKAGEEFYEIDFEYYHEECATDAAMDILTEHFGARKGIAEEENG